MLWNNYLTSIKDFDLDDTLIFEGLFVLDDFDCDQLFCLIALTLNHLTKSPLSHKLQNGEPSE